MPVKKIKRQRLIGSALPHWAVSIREARKRLGLTQHALAATLGVSQGTITRWEGGIDPIAVSAMLVMAELVPEVEKSYWQELAGIKATPISPRDDRAVPILRDAAAAGTPRGIDEKEIDFHMSLPPRLLPAGGKLYGLHVTGDSMSPILEEGDIVIVDVTRKNLNDVVGRMVAARDGEGGVTIKWLRRQGDDTLLLVPHNLSLRNPVAVIRRGSDFGIVGEVVLRIGLSESRK